MYAWNPAWRTRAVAPVLLLSFLQLGAGRSAFSASAAGSAPVALNPRFAYSAGATGGKHAVVVTTEAELNAALASNVTVRLGADIYLGAMVSLASYLDLTIDGAGFKVDGGDTVACFAVSRQAHIVIKDLTVTHCHGVAINVANGYLTLQACSIVDNYAPQQGGGLYLGGGFLKAIDCTISRNRGGFGGGVFAETGYHSFTRCVFSGNSAFNGGALAATPFGGAMSLDFADCVIEHNTASAEGGGLFLEFELNIAISNSVLRNNKAGQSGGAVFMALGGTTLSISHSNVTSNTAGGFGGGVYAISSPITVDGPCAFTNNSCAFDGGALYVQRTLGTSPSLAISADLAVTGNTAGRNGGGVLSYGGLVRQAYGTKLLFKENVAAGGSGGGLYVSYAGVASLQTLALSDATFEANTCSNKGGGLLVEVPQGEPKPGMLDCADCGDNPDGTTCRYIAVNSTWRAWDHGVRVALDRVSFTGNAARGPGASGGALALTNGLGAFSAVSFANNSASAFGGALFLSRSQYSVATAELTLSGVDFESNSLTNDDEASAPDSTGSGSALFSESSATLTLRNVTIRESRGSSRGGSVFEVRVGGDVRWSQESAIRCPQGYQLEVLAEVVPFPTDPLPGWNNTQCLSDVGPCPNSLESCWPPMLQQTVAYRCTACPPATYSLARGSLVGGVVVPVVCIGDCPYGGDCSEGADAVKARAGFFGFIQKKAKPAAGAGAVEEIAFAGCPRGYCCEDGEDEVSGGDGGGAASHLCPWDDACAGGRVGHLCGSCPSGFSVSLLGSGCVEDSVCDRWRSIVTLELVKSFGYAALFYFWPTAGFASPFALCVFHVQFFNELSMGPTSDSVAIAGLSFLLFSSSSNAGLSAGALGLQGSEMCAWPRMQPLTKAFFPLGEVLWIMAVCALAWLAGRSRGWAARMYAACSTSCRGGASCATAPARIIGASPAPAPASGFTAVSTSGARPVGEETASRGQGRLTPAQRSRRAHEERLVVAAAQALNFGLGAAVGASAALLTCTADLPGPSARLVLDADVVCWRHPWQWALLAAVGGVLGLGFAAVAGVVVFAAPPPPPPPPSTSQSTSLSLSLSQSLAQAQARALHSTDSDGVPRRGSDGQGGRSGGRCPSSLTAERASLALRASFHAVRSAADPVIKLAVAPFRPDRWWWLGAILAQRLALALLKAATALSPAVRSLLAVCVCVAAAVSQAAQGPFRSPHHNACALGLSTACALLAALNVAPAVLATNARSTSPEMDRLVDNLGSLQAFLLLAPVGLVVAWQGSLLGRRLWCKNRPQGDDVGKRSGSLLGEPLVERSSWNGGGGGEDEGEGDGGRGSVSEDLSEDGGDEDEPFAGGGGLLPVAPRPLSLGPPRPPTAAAAASSRSQSQSVDQLASWAARDSERRRGAAQGGGVRHSASPT